MDKKSEVICCIHSLSYFIIDFFMIFRNNYPQYPLLMLPNPSPKPQRNPLSPKSASVTSISTPDSWVWTSRSLLAIVLSSSDCTGPSAKCSTAASAKAAWCGFCCWFGCSFCCWFGCGLCFWFSFWLSYGFRIT